MKTCKCKECECKFVHKHKEDKCIYYRNKIIKALRREYGD